MLAKGSALLPAVRVPVRRVTVLHHPHYRYCASTSVYSYATTTPRYAPAMRSYNVTEGTREEILAELDTYGADRAQAGKTEKAEVIADALREVRDGATWVEISSRQVYRVVED